MTIEIIRATETDNPAQTASAAFALFDSVYQETPRHLGNFLSATEADFKANKTIVARPNGASEICGVMVCDPEPTLCHPLYEKFAVKNRILDALKLTSLEGLTLLSSLAVSEDYRVQGVATKLYEYSLHHSQNKCIGLMLKQNTIGDTTARKMGFHDIPGLNFVQNYRREGKKIVMDERGDLSCHWQMITTLSVR